MADYKRMYCVICAAADSVIEPLREIPRTDGAVDVLLAALETAENIYIDTAENEQ